MADSISQAKLELDASGYIAAADKAATSSDKLRKSVETPVDDHLSPKLRDVGRATDELHAPVQNITGALTTLFSGAALAGGAGLVGAFAASIKTAGDFEHTISGIKAVSDATFEEMGGLRELALKLGADTSFSASEAAKGIEELVKGGLTIPDIMNGAARATLDLAAAGDISIPKAAQITAAVLSQFELSGDAMDDVANKIAGAANASILSVEDFKYSIEQVGAVAHTSGQSFGETATAIAVMGAAGIKGSDAGTSLKTFLIDLIPKSKEATRMMRDLGIITDEDGNRFFDAEGKVKGFSEIAQVLQDAVHDLTEEQKLNTFHTLFGTDAFRAAAIMANAGKEGFDRMSGAIDKVTASAVAAERLNNLAGSMEILKGSTETAAIIFGSAFLPLLKELVDGIVPLVNDSMPDLQAAAESMVGAFREAVPRIREFFTFLWDHRTTILAVTTALAGFVILSTVAGWIGAAAAAIAGLSAAFGVVAASGGTIAAVVAILGGPVTLAIIGISVAIGLLTAAWINDWGDIREHTADAVDYLTGTALPAIRGFFDRAGEQFDALTAGITASTVAWAHLFDQFGTTLHDSIEGWGRGFDAFGTALDEVRQTIERWGRQTTVFFTTLFEDLGTKLHAWLYEDPGFVGTWQQGLEQVADAVGAWVVARVQEFGDFFDRLGVQVHAGLLDAPDGLVPRFTDALDHIASALRGWVQERVADIGLFFDRLGSAVYGGLFGDEQALVPRFVDALGQVQRVVGDALGHVLEAVRQFLGDLVAGWRDGLIGGGESVLSTVSRLAGALVPAMTEAGTNAALGLLDGLKSTILQRIGGGFFGEIWASLQAAANAAQQAQSPAQAWKPVGANSAYGLIAGLTDTMVGQYGVLGDAMTGAINALQAPGVAAGRAVGTAIGSAIAGSVVAGIKIPPTDWSKLLPPGGSGGSPILPPPPSGPLPVPPNFIVPFGNTYGGGAYQALQDLTARITAAHPGVSSSTLSDLIQQGMRSDPQYLAEIARLTQGYQTTGGMLGGTFMAEGGVVTRAMAAVIGEAGPEAVIPLSGAGLSVTIAGFSDAALGNWYARFVPVDLDLLQRLQDFLATSILAPLVAQFGQVVAALSPLGLLQTLATTLDGVRADLAVLHGDLTTTVVGWLGVLHTDLGYVATQNGASIANLNAALQTALGAMSAAIQTAVNTQGGVVGTAVTTSGQAIVNTVASWGAGLATTLQRADADIVNAVVNSGNAIINSSILAPPPVIITPPVIPPPIITPPAAPPPVAPPPYVPPPVVPPPVVPPPYVPPPVVLPPPVVPPPIITPPPPPPLTRPGAVGQASWQYAYQADPLAPPLIQVVWTAATGATDYVIRVNGAIIGTSTTTSYIVPDVPRRDGQTTFVVSGRNAAGEGPSASTSFAGHFGFNVPAGSSFDQGGLVGAYGTPEPLPFDLGGLLGGYAPASPGTGVLIQAHAGEAVLTRETTRALTRLLGAPGADGAAGLAGIGGRGMIGTFQYVTHRREEGELDVKGALWRAEQEYKARFGG